MLLVLAGVGVVQGATGPGSPPPAPCRPRRRPSPPAAPAVRRPGGSDAGARPAPAAASRRAPPRPPSYRHRRAGHPTRRLVRPRPGAGGGAGGGRARSSARRSTAEVSCRCLQDPRTVGWWGAGAAPGAPVGTIVLAGHVDSEQQGAGALYPLARTPVGARVVVSGPRRRGDVRRAGPAPLRQGRPAVARTCSGRTSRPGCCWSPAAATSTAGRGTTRTTSWSTRSRSAQPARRRPDDPAAEGVRRLPPGERHRRRPPEGAGAGARLEGATPPSRAGR